MLGHRCLHEPRFRMLDQKLNSTRNFLEISGQCSCKRSSRNLTMYDARPRKNSMGLILLHRPLNTSFPILGGPARDQMGFYLITRVQVAKWTQTPVRSRHKLRSRPTKRMHNHTHHWRQGPTDFRRRLLPHKLSDRPTRSGPSRLRPRRCYPQSRRA